jgi:peptide/nickel transport system substrate-binding protein
MPVRRNTSKTLALLSVSCLGLAALAACGGGSSASSASSGGSAAGAPQRGGTLTVAWDYDPPTMDLLHYATGEGSTFVSGDQWADWEVFDALAYENPTTGALVMETAKSITSTGPSVWTITLKPGIKFTDGTPYDAAAIEFNYKRAQDPANTSYDELYADEIKTMQVVNPLTLKLTLTAADSEFGRVIAKELCFIGSPAAIKSEGAQFGLHPVGAGPFILTNWIHGSQLTLVRNPHYWNAPYPYVNKLIINIIPNNTQRLNALLSGQDLLIGSGIEPQIVPQATAQGFKALEVNQPIGGEGFVFDTVTAPFNSLLARRAVAAALDYKGMDQAVFNGLYPAVTHLIDQPSPFYNAADAMPSYNPTLAQQLLNQYFAQTGKPLTFTMLVSQNSYPEGEYFVSQLEGQFKHIAPKYEEIADAAFIGELATHKFQMSVDAIGGYAPEPGFSLAFSGKSPENFGGLNDPTLNAALQTGLTSDDLSTQVQAYNTVQSQVIAQLPLVLTYPNAAWAIYSTKVHNVQASAGYPLYQYMWVSS